MRRGAVLLISAGLLAGGLLAGCQGEPPAPAPEIGQVPCLAPLQPGEPDPALRDLRVVADGKTATFHACVVSRRFPDMESLGLNVAFLSRDVDRRGEGRYVLAGNTLTQVRHLQGALPGMPRFVGLLAAQVPFGPMADLVAVRLGFSPCAPADGQPRDVPCTKAYDRIVPIPAFRRD